MKEIIIVLLFVLSFVLAAKSRSCPDSSGMIGICVERCSSDYHCTGSQKCCFDGCGHTCQNPTNVRSALTCLYNGTTYHTGDSFKSDDGCNTCGCNNGIVFCTLMACLSQTDLFLNKTIV